MIEVMFRFPNHNSQFSFHECSQDGNSKFISLSIKTASWHGLRDHSNLWVEVILLITSFVKGIAQFSNSQT